MAGARFVLGLGHGTGGKSHLDDRQQLVPHGELEPLIVGQRARPRRGELRVEVVLHLRRDRHPARHSDLQWLWLW